MESARPLTEEEYTKTFATLFEESTEYTAMLKTAKSLIADNRFDVNPITMFSIGAGTGEFELSLVKDAGLNLKYMYGLEPNPVRSKSLKSNLVNCAIPHDIDTRFFDPRFELGNNDGSYEKQSELPHATKFDLILMSQIIYCFDDPWTTVFHATTFLKPHGKLLLFTQGDSTSSNIYRYLIRNSNPTIFSCDKTIADHAIVPETIISNLKERYPGLKMSLVEANSSLEVDDFVRQTKSDTMNDVVSFLLQANYKDLSRDAQEYVYNEVSANCDLVEDKWHLRHPTAAIVISASGR